MRPGYRKCRRCRERSRTKDWWKSPQPVENLTGMEEIAGTSTANVIQHGWTRATYRSRSVLIACPQCGHTVTVRDKKSQGFW